MKRLQRAGLVCIALSSLAGGTAWAGDRLVSLLPPVAQAPADATPGTPAGPGGLATPPFDASGGLKPKGANLPKASPVPEALAPAPGAATVVEGEGGVAFQMELPQVAMPDVGSHFASIFCSGPYNPADVDDPTWVRFEALLYWFRDMEVPALVTTSTNPEDLGILGRPSTQILFGGGGEHLPMRVGSKVTIGTWFQPSEALGIEVSYAFIINRSQKFYVASDGGVLIARPFTNAQTGDQDAVLVANPDIPAFDIFRVPGQMNVYLPGRLNSLEVSGVSNYCRGANGRVDWFFGFRQVFLTEAVNIWEQFRVPDDAPEQAGFEFMTTEGISTKNYIYTGQIGVRTENRWGPWALNLEAKLGLGWNHTAANLEAVTGMEEGGQLSNYTGGVVVLKSNAGNYNADHFIVVPEVGFRVSYQVLDHFFITAGYQFLFLSTVWRPGDQIDLNINPNLFPPAQGNQNPFVPTFPGKTTSFWAQGITLGMEVKY